MRLVWCWTHSLRKRQAMHKACVANKVHGKPNVQWSPYRPFVCANLCQELFFGHFLIFLEILSKHFVFSWSKRIKWIILPLFHIKKESGKFIGQWHNFVYVSEKLRRFQSIYLSYCYEWFKLNVLLIYE